MATVPDASWKLEADASAAWQQVEDLQDAIERLHAASWEMCPDDGRKVRAAIGGQS